MSATQLLLLILLITTTEGTIAVCRSDIPRTSLVSDFTINSDGTTTHNKTGLMWMRCLLGQDWDGNTCLGSGQEYTWQSALELAERYNYASHNDWRLPNIKEFVSIIERSCYDPAMDITIFPGAAGHIAWSSTISYYHNDGVWGLNSRGSTFKYHQSNKFAVRLVRDEP